MKVCDDKKFEQDVLHTWFKRPLYIYFRDIRETWTLTKRALIARVESSLARGRRKSGNTMNELRRLAGDAQKLRFFVSE